MKKLLFISHVFYFGYVFSQGTLLLQEIKDCASRTQTEKFTKLIQSKGYVFLKEIKKDGIRSMLYAMDKDTNSVLITTKSSNLVEIAIPLSVDIVYKNLFKELEAANFAYCHGGWLKKPEGINASDFRGYFPDKDTKIILFKEKFPDGNIKTYHIGIVTLMKQKELVSFNRQEHRNCLEWFNYCEKEMEEFQKKTEPRRK